MVAMYTVYGGSVGKAVACLWCVCAIGKMYMYVEMVIHESSVASLPCIRKQDLAVRKVNGIVWLHACGLPSS